MTNYCIVYGERPAAKRFRCSVNVYGYGFVRFAFFFFSIVLFNFVQCYTFEYKENNDSYESYTRCMPNAPCVSVCHRILPFIFSFRPILRFVTLIVRLSFVNFSIITWSSWGEWLTFNPFGDVGPLNDEFNCEFWSIIAHQMDDHNWQQMALINFSIYLVRTTLAISENEAVVMYWGVVDGCQLIGQW